MLIRTWIALVLLGLAVSAGPAVAQDADVVRGRVTFEGTGDPVHGAVVLIVGANRSATTNEQGAFEIRSVPAGTWDVLAQREHLTTGRQRITVGGEGQVELAFALGLLPVHEQLTVTASPGGESTTFEAFNAIHSLDSFDIARSAAPSLAALVQNVSGVDMRSFGPGSERPIIRGFDGDRVLILEDGVRSGDLSSQSGDHGTTLDPGSLDRVEVVRGPATLLYGSNAIGGVVHALTPQEAFRRTPFSGLRGQILTDGGSGNGQAGANANMQYGQRNWLFWAGGGSRRSGDYQTPDGVVENSASRLANGRVGLGYTGSRAFFSMGYGLERGRYGVPFAGEFHAHHHEEEGEAHEEREEHEELFVAIEPRRHNLRFDVGARDLQTPLADAFRVIVSHLDWRHDEIEIEEGIESLGTRFDNRTTIMRAEIEQRKNGRLSGRFGISGELRRYAAAGEEALAPDTAQRTVGLFAYEQLDFGRARLMFGGRLDHTAYNTVDRDGPVGGHVHEEGDEHEEGEEHDHEHDIVPPGVHDRRFTGGSGSVGLHVDVAPRTAFVATLTRSYRAPALEELYNFGPHVGNMAFEIGNTGLAREASVGLDVSLRHRSSRARGEVSVFSYAIDDFVFASTDHDEVVDGLPLAEYRQSDSRFTGVDAQVGLGLHEHLWVHASAGYVNARLTELDEYVPRIPPLHARLSIEIPVGGLTVGPEVVWAARQARTFRDETATAAYALLNVNASYILARSHHAHVFTVNGMNLTNALYRRHTSFIKDLAPEMGRSVRVSYGIRFF